MTGLLRVVERGAESGEVLLEDDVGGDLQVARPLLGLVPLLGPHEQREPHPAAVGPDRVGVGLVDLEVVPGPLDVDVGQHVVGDQHLRQERLGAEAEHLGEHRRQITVPVRQDSEELVQARQDRQRGEPQVEDPEGLRYRMRMGRRSGGHHAFLGLL